ncbi:OmpA family protein [Salinisphaera sp. P385]|uniref:OmpA family protein n=1 Tax=Spectribacter acetivorans TaxID=3075603 RepID=A0ABU3B564_9GAMM|nr:OmpA family protein [Salinisphaera sp. P385]MDT0617602.1 OmpA family protein [Salinisphaera sp. P385]
MSRTYLVLSLVISAAWLGGCAVWQTDPVPPPPPPPAAAQLGDGDVPQTVQDKLRHNDQGEPVGFAALDAAEQAVNAARRTTGVDEYAPEALQQAVQTLDAARATWSGIADDPLSSPAGLAEVGRQAHAARRWAQIARADARRETGLRQLATVSNKLDARDAVDQRWAGTMVAPGEFGELVFATGTDRLTGDSMAVVDRVATFLDEHPRYRVQVVGHTDNTPPSAGNLSAFLDDNPDLQDAGRGEQAAAYNRAVSQRRADAVRAALLEQGVADSRIDAEGRGAADPRASNDSAGGRRANRRVEITLVLPPRNTGS